MTKELIPFPEDTELAIGKYYNVRCAVLEYKGGIVNIPIIGIEHADHQFKFPDKHYHYDGRFGYWKEQGRTNDVIVTETPVSGYKFLSTTVKRRKCQRLTTGLIPGGYIFLYKDHWYTKWYRSMLGKSCAGKRCPHLGTSMIEKDGNLFCPLHNLEGCAKEEKIILPRGIKTPEEETTFVEYFEQLITQTNE